MNGSSAASASSTECNFAKHDQPEQPMPVTAGRSASTPPADRAAEARRRPGRTCRRRFCRPGTARCPDAVRIALRDARRGIRAACAAPTGAERVEEVEPDRAALGARQRLDFGLRGVEGAQCDASMSIEDLAVPVQFESASLTVEECHADLSFEACEFARKGRLRQVSQIRGSGHLLGFGEHDKPFEVFGQHHEPNLYTTRAYRTPSLCIFFCRVWAGGFLPEVSDAWRYVVTVENVIDPK